GRIENSSRSGFRAFSCARADLLAFRFIEQRACIVDRFSRDVEEHAITRLTEYVPPVVSLLPELRVLHCHADRPEHRDEEKPSLPENRERNDDGVHSDVRRELLAEFFYRRRVPSCEVVWRRNSGGQALSRADACVRRHPRR